VSEAVERAKSQGIWLAIGQVASRAAQFLSTIALARLLLPEHFGKVAIAAVVWEVVSLFGNTGVAATIIQRRDLSADLLDAAFWLNGAVAAGIAAASLGVALAAARFYHEPSIVPILGLYALSFVISSVGSIHAVLLAREVSFGRLALLDTTSAVTSAGLSVALALAGFGFWSLVLHAPAIAALRTIFLWRLHRWRPRARLRTRLWREIFGYGRYVLGAELAGYVSLNGDYMITGKVLGENPLGVYSMAYRVANWPVEAGVWLVSRIAFPTLSGLQDDPERLASAFTKMMRMVAILAFPAVAVLFVVAPDLVAVLYGDERWGGATPLIQILLPYVALRSLSSPAAQVLLAVGQARRSFLFGIVVVPLLLAAVALGTRHGITGVAVATSTVLGLAAIGLAAISCRAAHAPLRTVLAALGPGAALGLIALVSSAASLVAFSGLVHGVAPSISGAWARAGRLGAGVAAGGVAAWLAAAILFPEDRSLVLRALGEGSVSERLRQLRRGLAASVLGKGEGS
jgi:O-antigen/teichoic acid export membrane protein